MREKRALAFAMALLGSLVPKAPVSAGEPGDAPFEVPVLVVSYFPVKGANIDIEITGDWGASLAATREKTRRLTRQVARILEDGSRFRAYRNPKAEASVRYKVLKTLEHLEPLPTVESTGRGAPMTDYNAIMERVDIRSWVEKRGVKEVWLWGYHGGKVGLWESNMASRHGDVSNSNRDAGDLPILARTYTVYHYNYQRGASEAVEDHMHQFEALLNFVDGRDRTPREKWDELLFWGRFVGSDASHRIVRPGCGWAHYPPNGERDYDWANPRYVLTDIEDWKPDGTGERKRINCERWGGDSVKWFTYWMQSLPGDDNGLTHEGRPLTNWWLFVGDFDRAMEKGITLVGEPAAKARARRPNGAR